MFKLKFIFNFILITIINQIICNQNIPIQSDKQVGPTVNIHLKWVTNQTNFPMKLSIPVDENVKNNSLNWDWIRTRDQKLVSKMPDILKNYIVTESDSRSNLFVLNYNNVTHEQLATFEPKLVLDTQDGPVFMNTNRDLFTLAYLKKHYIKSDKSEDKIQVTCVADFLIPNMNNEQSDAILKLMEKYTSFKLAIRSPNFPKKKFKAPKKTSDLFLFDTHENVNQQTQQLPSQQPTIQLQPVFQQAAPQLPIQSQPVPQLPIQSQPVPQLPIQSQPVQQLPIQQQQPLQQLPIQHQQVQQVPNPYQQVPQLPVSQQSIPQHQPQFLPNQPMHPQLMQPQSQPIYQYPMYRQNQHEQQMQQIYNQPPMAYYQPRPIPPQNRPTYVQQFYEDHAYMNGYPTYDDIYSHDDFINDPHFNEMVEEYNNFVSHLPTRQRAGLPKFDIKPRSYIHPLDWHDYDDFFYRFKRESKSHKVTKNEEDNEIEDFDYDTNKFSKVRLSLGPVSIHKPFDNEEVVSCMLNLINYDDVNLAYHSRIFKRIKTMNSKNNQNQDQKQNVQDDLNEQKEINTNEEINVVDKKNEQETLNIVKEHSEKNNMMFMTDKKINDKAFKFEHHFIDYNSGCKKSYNLVLATSFILCLAIGFLF